ncbi:MAG: RNA-binding S4 domain-containing protein [Nitrospirae bacterium]|nr:RNA-binding S4 domain-containing protein [Nitrospirota bacterium]
MEEFILNNREYIELNNLLKVLGLCDTGGMAKAAIAEGHVRVNGSLELRKRCKLRKGDRVAFEGHEIIIA